MISYRKKLSCNKSCKRIQSGNRKTSISFEEMDVLLSTPTAFSFASYSQTYLLLRRKAWYA